jgi:hypothetical protein
MVVDLKVKITTEDWVDLGKLKEVVGAQGMVLLVLLVVLLVLLVLVLLVLVLPLLLLLPAAALRRPQGL